jgi:AbrB family looped-hinge helix DNA binding protein
MDKLIYYSNLIKIDLLINKWYINIKSKINSEGSVIMTVATLTSKGQIVIPSRMRARFGMKKGTRVLIEEHGDEMILRPVTNGFLEKAAGILSTKGRLSAKLIDEHKNARDRE